MKNHARNLLVTLVVFVTLNFHLLTVFAQGTTVTYQGRLNVGGAPANGLYDFRFKLAVDPLANNYIGGDFLTNGVAITNGLFLTQIDFGPNIFTGSNYWLEVDVRTNNPGNTLSYTMLTPLQAVTPTPYAIMANSASNLLGTLQINQLNGTVPLAQLPGAVVTNGEAGLTLSNITINGNLNLPLSTMYSGSKLLVRYDTSPDFFAGLAAGNTNITDGYNTGIGNGALNAIASGGYNTAVGHNALEYATNGFGDTAVGIAALANNLTGSYNTGIGCNALLNNTNGTYNTANGAFALDQNKSGSENLADGDSALYYLLSGTNDIAVGYNAGSGLYYEESNDIDIGNNGIGGESGIIRIGTPGTQTATYLTGNVAFNGALNVDSAGGGNGVVTSNALTFGTSSGEGICSDRSTSHTDSFGLNFYTDFDKRMTILQNGNVGIGNAAPGDLLVVGSASSPAYCNGGNWVNASDRNSKEDFANINPLDVLNKVSAMPITEWRYKIDTAAVKHIGPMAQDFHAAFGLNGGDDKHISTVDEGGIALAAIQGLNQKLEETRTQNAELQKENDSLAERLNELEATVKQLAAQK